MDNIGKGKPASNLEDVAEQIQSVKKRKKVSWKMLDFQHQLHKSVTYNKLAALTYEKEHSEDERSVGGNSLLALITAVQETRAESKVNTRKNTDKLQKVQEIPVGGCAKNSSDALSACMEESVNHNRQRCV